MAADPECVPGPTRVRRLARQVFVPERHGIDSSDGGRDVPTEDMGQRFGAAVFVEIARAVVRRGGYWARDLPVGAHRPVAGSEPAPIQPKTQPIRPIGLVV